MNLATPMACEWLSARLICAVVILRLDPVNEPQTAYVQVGTYVHRFDSTST